MNAKSETASHLTLTRVFDAPRELVFKCWTEPTHFIKWFGPENYTIPECTIDLRVGGKMHSAMRSPEGMDIWFGGVYKEIDPPRRLVVTDYFSNEEGDVIDPTEIGFSDDWPRETYFDITFEEVEGNKTKLTVRHMGVTEELAKSVQEDLGWSQSFDKLDAYIAGM